MKMTEYQLFMDQFPPNHHRISFLVHENHSVKSKRKNMKKLGLKAFFVMMPTLQKGRNLAWKRPNLGRLWTDFPKPPHNLLLGSWESFCEIEMKKKKIEETRSEIHDAYTPKTAEIRHENDRISAIYGPISSKPPQNFLFFHKNYSVKSKRKKKKWRN